MQDCKSDDAIHSLILLVLVLMKAKSIFKKKKKKENKLPHIKIIWRNIWPNDNILILAQEN